MKKIDVIYGVVDFVVYYGLSCLIVKWLWNYLMPDLFGFSELTFIKAFLLFLLSQTFFNSSYNSRNKN